MFDLFNGRSLAKTFLALCFLLGASEALAACKICKPPYGAEFQYSGNCPSGTIFVRNCPSAPPVPTGLSASPTPSYDGSFTLSWNASSGATKYDLIEKVGGNWYSWQKSSVRTKSFSGKTEGAYEYRVIACGSNNLCSSSSPSVFVDVVDPLGENVSGPPSPVLGDHTTVVEEQKTQLDRAGVFSGNFRVNESGAVNYTVLLKLPAGTAGVTPQISLEYNSGGGNGPLGLGWSISGVDAITRCRQTLLQDGRARPITWSAEDRFCYNGQRLLLTSSNKNYGEPGSEYKTEIDSFVKVAAVGGTVGHPDYFALKAKDGSTTFFGESGASDSERSAYLNGVKAANRVSSWSRSRFEDSVGNAIAYRYAQTEGYFYIEDIYYGAGENPGSSNFTGRVQFQYLNRPDVISGWAAGYEFKNTKRLYNINVYSSNTRLRRYHLAFSHSANSPSYEAPNKLSRLSGIQECASTTNCLPPLNFKWGGKSLNSSYKHGFSAQNVEVKTHVLLDINGDGLVDTAWLEADGNTRTLKYNIQGDGTLPTASRILGSLNEEQHFFPIDLNADGRMDLMYHSAETQKWYSILSTPDVNAEMGWKLADPKILPGLPSFPDLYPNSGTAHESSFGPEFLKFGDFNSDGLTDFSFYLSPAALTSQPEALKVFYLQLTGEKLSDGSAEFKFKHDSVTDSHELGFQFNRMGPMRTGDFNGDGRADVAVPGLGHDDSSYERSIVIGAQIESGFEFNEIDLDVNYVEDLRTPDINGDGLNDIAYFSTNSYWYFSLSTGNSFTPFVRLYSPSSIAGDNETDLRKEKASFVDIDGDGNIEVLWRSNLVINTNGTSLNKPILYKSWDPQTQSFSENQVYDENASGLISFMFVDLSGDGVLDYTTYGISTGNIQITSLGARAYHDEYDAIKSISSGFGAQTSIQYEPLSTTVHYTTLEGVKAESVPVERCYPHPNIPLPPDQNPEEVCDTANITVTNADALYEELYEPFTGLSEQIANAAPVMEVRGPMHVVTTVSSNAPTLEDSASTNQVHYFYETARYQAGGRGYLGFKKLSTLDPQTGVSTETSYRQDWPYAGRPIETIRRSSTGMVLSRDANEYSIYAYDSLQQGSVANSGTKILGPLQVYTSRSSSTSYGLEGNGSIQGEALSTFVTLNTPDAWGNSDTMEIATLDGGVSVNSDGSFTAEPDYSTAGYYSKKKVKNEYYNSDEGRLLARLIRSTATTNRSEAVVPEGYPTESIKISEFTYYGLNGACSAGQGGNLQGMLCDEIISEEGSVQLTTRHHYDRFGNETWNYAWGPNGEARLAGFVEYDSNGRYPVKTYNAYNGQLNSVSLGDASYSSAAAALNMSVGLRSEVISRDAYGTPTEVHTWLDENTYTTGLTYTTEAGNIYFTTASHGSYQITLASAEDTTNCPADTAYTTSSRAATGSEGRSCFDLLGRKRRSLSRGFNGSWVAIDTEYDMQSRAYRTSEPFYVSGGAASQWTTIEYDLLNRPTKTVFPYELTDSQGAASGIDASGTVNYEGFLVTTITPGVGSAPARKKIETKNILGELVRVTEFEGPDATLARTAKYAYDVDGNLVSLKDPAGNATTMTYGVMGQKTSMLDLNKGFWEYKYSAFGDLLCQKDAMGNIIKQHYDGRGRMVRREDFIGGSCTSPTGKKSEAVWEFDVAENGLGQLSDEQDLISGYGIVNVYDELGRISQTTTAIPGSSASDLSYHYTAQNYDEYGRVYQSFDAARSEAEFDRAATQNIYNDYGYLDQIIDAHQAETGGVVYYDVETMDERGNIVSVKLANGVTQSTNTYNQDTGNLEGITTSSSSMPAGSEVIQDMSMAWDHLGNLRYRHDRGQNKNGSKRNYKEDFEYDAQNRLTDYLVTNNNNNAVQAMYVSYYQDGTGNIHTKSGVGTYSYQNGGPHAVSSVGSTVYNYNANGSVTDDGTGRQFAYTAFDKVAQIDLNSRRTNFYYGTGRSRYKRVDTKLNVSPNEEITTLYIGNVEKIFYADDTVQWKRNIGGVAQITYEFEIDANAENGLAYQSESLVYFHKDHLGSINAITNESGQLIEELMFFDPWGARRNEITYQPTSTAEIAGRFFKETKPETSRGFTGHEMVDEMNIIHMNGRIYDSKLARFVQADPIVQEPGTIASLNRYSYGMNNPLNGTDPSGYSFMRKLVGVLTNGIAGEALAQIDPRFRTIMQIVHCAYSVTACVMSAYGNTYAAGGSEGDALKAGALAAVSAKAFGEIGQSFRGSSGAWNAANGPLHVLSHATLGGVMSVLQGGEFGHGFYSAGFTKMVTPGLTGISGGELSNGVSLHQAFAAAIVGGTVSAATGGKFANGAVTAAMGNLFNQQNTPRKLRYRLYEQSPNDESHRVVADGKGGLKIKLASPKEMNRTEKKGARMHEQVHIDTFNKYADSYSQNLIANAKGGEVLDFAKGEHIARAWDEVEASRKEYYWAKKQMSRYRVGSKKWNTYDEIRFEAKMQKDVNQQLLHKWGEWDYNIWNESPWK